MGRRRITRKRAAAVLTPVAASIAAVGLGTGTASAAFVTDEEEFTYRNFAGQTVTCTISSVNDFEPSRDDVAFAETFVSGDPECEENFVSIFVTYLAPGRQPASSQVAGTGFAFGSWEPVVDDFRSDHFVGFDNCDFRVSDCDYDVTLVQPK